ncbi:MAG: TadE/TadG family type IV pilus assembly protein [Erythrobacter cryptus]
MTGIVSFLTTRMRRLVRHEGGATIVEFAFVAPVLIMMLLGLFDMAHNQYTSAMLTGAMQKAGRDLTLENAAGRQSQIDDLVRQQVKVVMPAGASISITKLSHFDFADIGEPEPILGDNGNNRCDPGETYIDVNDSGAWEADRGKTGIGGARDAVLYTATVRYRRLFPVFVLAGMSPDVTLSASTVLRNQPFDEQDRSTVTRNC